MLTLENVSKTYPNHKRGIQNVTLTLTPGVTAIIGPSGAGKTTLLRSINHLITPDAGTVALDQTVATNARSLRRMRQRIGMIFQDYSLIEELTALENVLHGCLGKKPWLAAMLGRFTPTERQRAQELLAQVGLAEFSQQRCRDLSGGQKQRVGIARALMQDPQVILCDEPIASLDPASTQTVMTLLQELGQAGIIVVVNLHQVDITRAFADRVIGVNAGQVVFDGPSTALDEAALTTIYQEARP